MGSFNILAVDDEPANLELYKEILSSMTQGEFFTASNGEEALEVVAENKVDLIVLDLVMPKYDGIQFIERFKSFNNEIPVVVVTGFSHRYSKRDLWCRGAFEFIEKPFELDDFRSVCLNAVLYREKYLATS